MACIFYDKPCVFYDFGELHFFSLIQRLGNINFNPPTLPLFFPKTGDVKKNYQAFSYGFPQLFANNSR